MSYSILVVDDSPVIRKIMRRSLGLSKLEVRVIHEATNGVEALVLLRREHVDVVLADIHMPVMGGTELIESMSIDAALKGIPVVVVSAERSQPALPHLEALGICGHLTKPFTPEQLMGAVSQVLGHASRRLA